MLRLKVDANGTLRYLQGRKRIPPPPQYILCPSLPNELLELLLLYFPYPMLWQLAIPYSNVCRILLTSAFWRKKSLEIGDGYDEMLGMEPWKRYLYLLLQPGCMFYAPGLEGVLSATEIRNRRSFNGCPSRVNSCSADYLAYGGHMDILEKNGLCKYEYTTRQWMLMSGKETSEPKNWMYEEGLALRQEYRGKSDRLAWIYDRPSYAESVDGCATNKYRGLCWMAKRNMDRAVKKVLQTDNLHYIACFLRGHDSPEMREGVKRHARFYPSSLKITKNYM